MVKNERSFCIAYVLTISPKSGKNTYARYRSAKSHICGTFFLLHQGDVCICSKCLTGKLFLGFLRCKTEFT